MAMDPMTMPAISPPLSESGGGVSEVNVTKESERRDLYSSWLGDYISRHLGVSLATPTNA